MDAWKGCPADRALRPAIRSLVVPRSGAVSIGRGFGNGSPVGCRTRTPVWRLVCRPRLVRLGSPRMVGWPRFAFVSVSGRYLSFVEREEIALLHARDCWVREIARQLGRSPSTI